MNMKYEVTFCEDDCKLLEARAAKEDRVTSAILRRSFGLREWFIGQMENGNKVIIEDEKGNQRLLVKIP